MGLSDVHMPINAFFGLAYRFVASVTKGTMVDLFTSLIDRSFDEWIQVGQTWGLITIVPPFKPQDREYEGPKLGGFSCWILCEANTGEFVMVVL
jgi:hypothetical protein